ncbi:DoxX family protein [Isoalcanivorax beigongshangi]|uniref:DoxX family protein n=1 Tax=Isoalcanivorax beigongshangi TaxID=3238810 RepID=A0ABV4AM20_9GAMM
MNALHQPDLGKLILRLTLGILLLLHGIAKLRYGIDWIGDSLVGMGLPRFIAYGVYVGEILAPLMLILGIYARIGALLAVGNMAFAILIAHMGELWQLNDSGGWALELQGFFLFTALALVFIGPGRYAVRQ